MFVLDEDELRYVIRGLAPQARREGVAEELRGWNWHQAPLAPLYDAALDISDIVDGRCSCGRTVYLRHVLGAESAPGDAELTEAALIGATSDLIVAAKRITYEHGQLAADQVRRLLPPSEFRLHAATAAEQGRAAAVQLLWSFQAQRAAARIEASLARQPHASADALAATALPFTVGRFLDGRYLGLARQIPIDAVGFPEPVVFSLRFGKPEPWHRLAPAGQALLLEALHETPVNLGAITYVVIADGQVRLSRDLFVIDDELRQSFVDARDERARLVEEEIDPGLSAACPESCPLLSNCHG